MNIWLKIFLTCVVSHKVQMKRQVVNTTCLRLAKPSSQQLRLTCSQYNYHCLLDETLTKEFEVCREWKWIPKGQCAYFNTYGEGNIDGRHCVNSANLVCPTRQYSSAQTTKYTACYVKKTTSTIEPRTRILYVTSTESSDGGISTFPNSEINDNQRTIMALLIALVIVTSVIIFAAVSYFGRLKCFQRLRKVIPDKKEEDNEDLTDMSSKTDESTPITEPPIVKSYEKEDVKKSYDESLQRILPPKAGYGKIEDKEKSAESTLETVGGQRMEFINEEESEKESIESDKFYDAQSEVNAESMKCLNT